MFSYCNVSHECPDLVNFAQDPARATISNTKRTDDRKRGRTAQAFPPPPLEVTCNRARDVTRGTVRNAYATQTTIQGVMISL